MSTNDPQRDVLAISQTAGLTLTEERIAAIAVGAKTIRASLEALFAADFGTSEPASRFRPPPAR